jgi:hypothetical protein
MRTVILLAVFVVCIAGCVATQRAHTAAVSEKPGLIFLGTVESIEASPIPQSLAEWVVTFRVDRIERGDFAEKTFSIRIHSPAKSGLEAGKQYVVEARRTPTGYEVDQHQWKHRAQAAQMLTEAPSGQEHGQGRADDATFKVEVVGINWVDPGSIDEDHSLVGESRGAKLTLLVTSSAPGLLALDAKASRIDTFADDKGTDLLQGRSIPFGPLFSKGEPVSTQISPDRTRALIEVGGGHNVPAKGAAQLRIKGTLAFRWGPDAKVYRAENIELKEGMEIPVGKSMLKVSTVSRELWHGQKIGTGEQALTVHDPETRQTVSLNTGPGLSVKDIARVAFFDLQGREIDSWPGTFSGFAEINGNPTWGTLSYCLRWPMDTATVVITICPNMQTIKVPFDVTATLGL